MSVQAPYLSHIRREKSHHPHVTASQRRYRKVTSGSGKSHQGRRITMAQPVSSVIGDLVRSSRSIAHSDDFEGHKSIQTNSWQQILLEQQATKQQASKQQASKQQASKQQQASSSQQAAASKQQQAVSSKQAAASKQQASSKQAASKQQASSKQAAATSACPLYE